MSTHAPTDPRFLVVKTASRKWSFFSIATDLDGGPSVSAKHTVTRAGRKRMSTICTCSGYALSKSCIHSEFLKRTFPRHESESDHVKFLRGGEVGEWGTMTNSPKVNPGDMWICPKGDGIMYSFAPPSIDLSLAEFIGGSDTTGVSTTRSYERLAHELEFKFLQFREPSLAYKIPDTFSHREMAFPSVISSFKPKVEQPWEGVPKPSGFSVTDADWRMLLYCICRSKPVMLIGGTGCGKTELVAHAVEALDRELESFNCGAMQNPRTSLIGRTHLGDAGTFFKKARFVEAVTEDNTVILADEISRSSVDVFNILLPVLDRQGYISIDESEETEQVFVAPTVSIIATANVGSEYTGTTSMDRALTDRFLKINLDYPEPAEEVRVLCSRYNVPTQWVSTLVDCAWQQRKMARDDEFSLEISTRMLFDVVQMVSDGIPAEQAVNAAVLSAFSTDGGAESERENVRVLMTRKELY